MCKFSELEAFTAVVNQGGFTGAAKQIGISKSAVSKHVASLESRLGTRLLKRTTRRVTPTELGATYYTLVSKILSDASEADSLVNSMQSQPSGTLNVGCEADFGIHVLSPLLKDFKSKFPSLKLNIEFHLNQEKGLNAGGWDIAVRTGRRPDTELKVRKIGETQMHFVAGRDYIAQHGQPRKIDDLRTHELIQSYPHNSVSSWRVQTPRGELREIRSDGSLCINEGISQLEAAKSNLGIAHLPDFVCGSAIEKGNVVEVLDGVPKEHLGIFVLHESLEHTPPKVLAFSDFFAQHIPELGNPPMQPAAQ